jgi:serine/threonine protein kinase
MTPQWQQVDQLFHDALDHALDQRAEFLAQSCAGDSLLRNEVESLIASYEQAEDFIEQSASDVAAELLATGHGRLQVGENIGHYRIIALLGAGGMGEVYLAQDTQLKRQTALKFLPRHFKIDKERVRRFEQEARAASALNHPNIVTIYEIGTSNSSHFIATEFIDGETLRQRMQNIRLPLQQAVDIAAQVASALAVAHAAGIVHRDIKPENIMLRRDGFVKVLDFGIAKLTLQQSVNQETNTTALSMVNTNPGGIMGTAPYVSPEQARAEEVDRRTDVWSLGVVLYEMITGHVPFVGETPNQVMRSILECEPAQLSTTVDVPSELERIVMRALSKNREQRYQTADEMACDLTILKQELEIEARLRLLSFDVQTTTNGKELRRSDSHSEFPASQRVIALSSQEQPCELDSLKMRSPFIPSKLGVLVVGTAVLAVLISLAVWLYIRSSKVETESQSPLLAVQTASTERSVTYWLSVSRPNGQHQFESIGNSVFDDGSKFWFNVQTDEQGALYLFSYGRNDNSVYEWNTMFPTPVNNGGDAWLPANHANPLRTKTAFVLEGKSGIVELWIIWAMEPIPVLDEITRESYKTLGTVSKETHQATLRSWLEQNRPTQEILIDKENARVTLRGRSAVLVDRRELEYRPTSGGIKQ